MIRQKRLQLLDMKVVDSNSFIAGELPHLTAFYRPRPPSQNNKRGYLIGEKQVKDEKIRDKVEEHCFLWLQCLRLAAYF